MDWPLTAGRLRSRRRALRRASILVCRSNTRVNRWRGGGVASSNSGLSPSVRRMVSMAAAGLMAVAGDLNSRSRTAACQIPIQEVRSPARLPQPSGAAAASRRNRSWTTRATRPRDRRRRTDHGPLQWLGGGDPDHVARHAIAITDPGVEAFRADIDEAVTPTTSRYLAGYLETYCGIAGLSASRAASRRMLNRNRPAGGCRLAVNVASASLIVLNPVSSCDASWAAASAGRIERLNQLRRRVSRDGLPACAGDD